MQRVTKVLAAAVLAASLAVPAARVRAQTAAPPAGIKAEVIQSIEAAEKHLLALAEKFPQEKYSWHPEGARTTSQAFMHIAAGNYTYATFLGVPRPEGMTREALEKITDKAQVVATLKNSFAHIKGAIQNAGDLDKPIKLFGRDATVREAMIIAATHCHEHLGQLIAYARVNGIVPPWNEEQTAPRPPAKN
jgi:uncharacterized damage-inducible protein DinB